MAPETRRNSLRFGNFTNLLLQSEYIIRDYTIPQTSDQRVRVHVEKSRAFQQHKAPCNIRVLQNIKDRLIGSLNVDLFLGFDLQLGCVH